MVLKEINNLKNSILFQTETLNLKGPITGIHEKSDSFN